MRQAVANVDATRAAKMTSYGVNHRGYHLSHSKREFQYIGTLYRGIYT